MKDDTTRIRALETNQLFDIKNTIASGYLSGFLYPYEALKALTRTNKKMTKETIHEFIDTLNVNDDIKKELKNITPTNYTGI